MAAHPQVDGAILAEQQTAAPTLSRWLDTRGPSASVWFAWRLARPHPLWHDACMQGRERFTHGMVAQP
jgi:hypothetical protein